VWSAATWIALALVGLVLAAGVSIAASKLSRQHIGLSSEPLSAGRELAPAVTTTTHRAAPRHHRSKHKRSTPTQSTPAPVPPPPVPVTPAPAPVNPQPAPTQPRHGDDYGEDHSGGSHSGHGGDD
jgi:hypothetical protein